MDEPNLIVKSLLILKDGSITESCRKMGIDFQRMSRIIHGRVKVRPEEKRAIAWHLQKPIDELFENDRPDQT